MQDLIDRLNNRTGNPTFLNSGVLVTSHLPEDSFSYFDFGKSFTQFVKPVSRINPPFLNMPSDTLALPPHCHPGGEIAFVANGEYFDADISGKPIHNYSSGSIVVYGSFSTHRPLSKTGAKIFYVPLDGILFPGRLAELQADDPVKLLEKMESSGAPKPALDYARSWMLP